MYTYMSLFPHL